MMKIQLAVTVEADADDYRARLRDDVAKPTDAEIVAMVLDNLTVTGPLETVVRAEVVA